MINLKQKDRLIRLYLQGESKSEISRQLGVSRNTVRKYINEYEQFQDEIEQADTLDEKERLIIKSNEKPQYDASNRKRYKVTPELVDRIKVLIEKRHVPHR